jgi:hypothetical protein
VTSPDALEGLVEVVVELASQPCHVHAASLQDALAFRVVRERVQQVLERQVRMTPGDGFPVGNGEDDLE